jgi:hypothetical protein
MKGEVVYLYAFDVANEIALEKIQEILASKPFPFEIRRDHTFPKDVPLYKPVAVEPPPLPTFLGGRPVRLLLRVYEVGVVSVGMRVHFEVASLGELLPFHKAVLENQQTLDQIARDLCAEACKCLQDVMVHASPPSEPEAYTVFCLTEIESEQDVNSWLAENRRAVAELLTETPPNELSDMQVNEVLRIQHSFVQTDAVVIDWDAALVIDLGGYVDDVLYVLELANLQLEEYRMMDQRLDRSLDRAYEDLKRRRFGFWGTYSAALRTLLLFRVDLSKLNDEVAHISKLFGDWYLARVYLGARERFHLNQWRTSVEDRLEHLDHLYSVVNTDINNRRMVWLEALIVIFFAIDLLLIIFLKK